MPTQKTLREIIEKLSWALCMTCSNPSVPDCDKKKIDQAIFEIKSLIKEKLPKKKEIISCPHGEMSACDDCIEQNTKAIGYNSALTEIEKIVEKL